MNEIIIARFKSYQHLLVENASVSEFNITRQYITTDDGNIRIRATVIDGGLLEIAEYVALNDNHQIVEHSYTFHWQNAQNQLIQRWDNTDHFPKLPFAPHHIHRSDRTIEGNPELPTLSIVLSEIEQLL